MDTISPLNELLYKIFISEKYWLKKRDFKKGVSLIAIAQRMV